MTMDITNFNFGNAFKYPSAEFMRSHGIKDEAKIQQFAGKTMANVTTAEQALAALILNFHTEGARSLFSDFPGFDPVYAYAGPNDKKRRDQKDYFNSIWDTWKVSGDLAKVDPSVFSNRNTYQTQDRKSTRLNSSHIPLSRMPSSA